MRVFSNFATAIDGKIADHRTPHKMLGTAADRELMMVLRRQCDVVLVGANTLRASPRPLVVKAAKGRKAYRPVNAVVTASGVLDPEMEFWKAPDTIRFVFTTRRGFAAALASARDRAFVVEAGEDIVEPRKILERFKASGLDRVLVEGGGELVATFMAEKLLQEMFVTVTPWVLGGRDNPTMVGGEGLDQWAALELLRMKRVRNEIYCHYKVRGARRV